MTLRHFSSESVCEGHPDKVADRISDAVLDAMLAGDPHSRVACETMVTTGLAVVAGEVTTAAGVAIPEIVRDALVKIGYDRPEYGIDGNTCGVVTSMDRQSPDIARGVDTGGAGDQGMMFGFACDETPELLPAPIVYAHRLTRALAEVRRSGNVPWVRPDGKSQVTVSYDGDQPVAIAAVVLAAQHDPGIAHAEIEATLLDAVIRPSLPSDLFDSGTAAIHVNPTGQFVTGGPQGDVGLTGRKIIVDTYGGVGRHGGGAFSGKDGTKVDRSAAYAARWAAKNVVAAGAAQRCEIQLAYAIGVADPVSVWVDSAGTGRVPDPEIAAAVAEVFDFRPLSIIHDLGLRRPIFTPTSAYGHFGRPCAPAKRFGGEVTLFPWERTDRVDEVRRLLRI
ncbi:MAG: methionine adenosyltransferase [Gammaproteobacteria bacterium]|nr:methionine adenosyltransferase [Gammaproteobacteria bacterium]MDE0247686.1 methionine adenosyltransferase [Gammaproteobacteria bacterium]